MRRLVLLIPIMGALVVAAVPALRDQTRLQWAMIPRAATPKEGDRRDPIVDWIEKRREECVEFVEREHPNDADLLLAAGDLTNDGVSAIGLLQRAVELRMDGIAYSAYVDAWLRQGPWYDRVETSGVDPADAAGLSAVRNIIEERHLQVALQPEEIAPVLTAAKAWQRVDPENAVPVAVEAWCLLGLHRDSEAQERWSAASGLNRATAYEFQRRLFVARLLAEMGISEPEAFLMSAETLSPSSFARMSVCATAMGYFGHVAEMSGDLEDALKCWQDTIAIGQTTQLSAESSMGYLAGVHVESVGAEPIWRWYPDWMTGLRGGRLGGRFFFGPHHNLYVAEVGEDADEELVHRLVAARLSTELLGSTMTGSFAVGRYATGMELLVFGLLLALMIVLMIGVALFLGFGTGSDNTGRVLGPIARVALAVLPVLVITVAAGAILAVGSMFERSPMLAPTWMHLGASVGAALIVVALASLVVAKTRTGGSSTLRGWRRIIREVLPLAAVFAALLYLVVGVAAMEFRGRWLREWNRPEVNEMMRLRRSLGIGGLRARVPRNSYVRAYPPGVGNPDTSKIP